MTGSAVLQQIALVFALAAASLAKNVDAALLEAARQHDTAGALEALDRGAYAGIADSRGFTPLMWTSVFGNFKILGELLARDADVDRARYDGTTALALAAAHGYREIVAGLLRSQPLTDFEAELRAANENKHLDIARQLAAAKKLGQSLLTAASAGDVKQMEALIAAGAPVNYADAEEKNALIRAAANGNTLAVVMLLRHGAKNVYDAGHKRGKALMAAESAGRAEAVQVLLPLERDRLNARLWEAAGAGATERAVSVLRRGAEVNARDPSGQTALLRAIRGGHVETVKALLVRGADVDAGAVETAKGSASSGTASVLAELLQRKIEPGRPIHPLPVADSLRAIGEAIARYQQMPGLDLPSWKRTAAAQADLEARASRWRQTNKTPVEYGLSLTRDAMVLKSGLKTGDPALAKKILVMVGEDLETKIEDCERKGTALSTSIRLSVRTIKGGREVNNLQVLYMPKIMEVALGVQPDFFPGFSSPTADSLSPGRYLLWARDPQTGRNTERMPVRVGGGMSEIVIDLPVQ